MYNISPQQAVPAQSPVSPERAPQAPAVEEQQVVEQPKVDPRLAEMARRERMIREQTRQIQAEKQAMQAKIQQLENETNSKWREKVTTNPWDTLLEAGLTPEQATNIILNPPKPEEIEFKKLKKEIEDLKLSQDNSKNLFKQQQDEQYQQAKKQINTEVKMLVDSDESFETIKHMGQQEAVTELIEQTFLQNGYLMDVEQAAKEVEEYLVDHTLKLARLKKIQSRLNPAVDTAQKQIPNQKPQVNTLSNKMIASSKPLTEKERKERAILAFQGKL